MPFFVAEYSLMLLVFSQINQFLSLSRFGISSM